MEDNSFDQSTLSINQDDLIERQCNINQNDGDKYVKEFGENETTDNSKPSFSSLHLRIDSL